jgi:hypothetical protein
MNSCGYSLSIRSCLYGLNFVVAILLILTYDLGSVYQTQDWFLENRMMDNIQKHNIFITVS